MKEFRCRKCHKLLGKYRGNLELEIKCPRCGVNNHLMHTENQSIASRRFALTVKPVLER
ncbi:hypothetical protein ASZ90_017980 [hydrocarbon metagenome]|uniref:Com family DNA-binding transcriptional regulator n=1 Tax=hydrocarbon metagenome TaxID=938273 RepID=A0A0W8E7L8_9ZZZZ